MLRCAACSRSLDAGQPLPWRCPGETGDRHHILLIHRDEPKVSAATNSTIASDANPFVRFAPRLAWWDFVHAHGWSDEQSIDAIRRLDDRVATVAGTGFRITPLAVSSTLADAVGLDLLGEFVRTRADDRIGLVTFARYADLRCPPTGDHGALLQLLHIGHRQLELRHHLVRGRQAAALDPTCWRLWRWCRRRWRRRWGGREESTLIRGQWRHALPLPGRRTLGWE